MDLIGINRCSSTYTMDPNPNILYTQAPRASLASLRGAHARGSRTARAHSRSSRLAGEARGSSHARRTPPGPTHMRQMSWRSKWGRDIPNANRNVECLHTDTDGPAAPNPMLFHAPTFCTLAPMVMSAFRSSLLERTQLFLRKAAQIQPFLAVPYESRPPLKCHKMPLYT
jgi:hypothetical protein